MGNLYRLRINSGKKRTKHEDRRTEGVEASLPGNRG